MPRIRSDIVVDLRESVVYARVSSDLPPVN